MSGDLILEVNGQDLRTAAYEHVAYTLKVLYTETCADRDQVDISDASSWPCDDPNRPFKAQCSFTDPSEFSSQ